jgi:uncharacterized protein YhhL (DUF1145 family)
MKMLIITIIIMKTIIIIILRNSLKKRPSLEIYEKQNIF